MMSDVDYEANSSGPQAATWVAAMQAPGWAACTGEFTVSAAAVC
jgi:hypothetical protein